MPDNSDDDFLNELVSTYFPGEQMPRVRVNPQPRTLDAAKTGQLAFSYRNGDPDIYVNNDTDIYHKARGGDASMRQYIAGLLAHERAHLTSGVVDELPAYDAQLEFLRRINADPKVVKKVEITREQQLRRQQYNKDHGLEQ